MKKLIAIFFIFALCDAAIQPTKADAQITLIQFQDVATCRSWVSIPDANRIMVIYDPTGSGRLTRYIYNSASNDTDDGVLTIKPNIVSGAGRWKWFSDDTGASKVPVTGYGSGTAYNLTTSYAKIDQGTADPTITLPATGTYEIVSNVTVGYASLVTLSAATLNFKLRRTNNTAADIPNSDAIFTVPVITATAQTAGDCDIPVIYYTGTAGDVIELQGMRGAVSAGNITATGWVVANRIY